jgi:hypothetical protein
MCTRIANRITLHPARHPYVRCNGTRSRYGGEYVDMYEELDRLTVAEAAERLRGRRNGSSAASGDGAGYPPARQGRGRARVRVYLRPPDAQANPEAEGDGAGEGTDAYASSGTLEVRAGFLRREAKDCRKDESRRKDAIVTSPPQRVPEPEVPREPRNGHETAAEAPSWGRRRLGA